MLVWGCRFPYFENTKIYCLVSPKFTLNQAFFDPNKKTLGWKNSKLKETSKTRFYKLPAAIFLKKKIWTILEILKNNEN